MYSRVVSLFIAHAFFPGIFFPGVFSLNYRIFSTPPRNGFFFIFEVLV